MRGVSVMSASLMLTGVLAGCGGPPGYILTAAAGQLDFLDRAAPIEDSLSNDPTLTDEQRDKLAFVVRARTYAEDVVGLNIGNSYQEFVNLGGEPLAWNLSASRKEAFIPATWSFPFIGTFPYLGFFDLDRAETERDRLKDEGYDTMLYELDTYAIPILPDPITSPMLERSHISLADTIMHELLHNTIFRANDADFNESLATFVGREAGLEFLAEEFGMDDPILEEARESYEDEAIFNAFIADSIDRLQELYTSGKPTERILTEREAVFDAIRETFRDDVLPEMNNRERYEVFGEFPLNNAFLLAGARYNDHQELYAAVHDANDRDWSLTLAVFDQASRSNNPIAFLEQSLSR